jgi:transposase
MQTHKKFREWKPNDYASTPITPAAILPEDDLVFFLLKLFPQLDLTPIYAHYERETCGAPPFDVAMMSTLLLYAYSVGVFSSRKIALAGERNVAFIAIVGQQHPDFRSISDFRKIHLQALANLFVEVLQIAGEMGMVSLGNLSLDGSKVRANASRHKAMSDPDSGSSETAKEKMSGKLSTPLGRQRYAQRKHIVEPVFGQMKHARGFRQFLLRGLQHVQGEWTLLCLTHNLLKIWHHQCAPK